MVTIRDPKQGERPKDEKTLVEKAREDWFSQGVPTVPQKRSTDVAPKTDKTTTKPLFERLQEKVKNILPPGILNKSIEEVLKDK